MSGIFLLSQDSKFMTFAIGFECSNNRTFDFVNVMNSYIDIHNHLFVFCLLFKFKHAGCWKIWCPKEHFIKLGQEQRQTLDSLEMGSDITRQKLTIGNL